MVHINLYFSLLVGFAFVQPSKSGPYSYYGTNFVNYTLEDYAVITAHNAYSAGLITGAQGNGIGKQLRDGVRGFMLDTYDHIKVFGDRIIMCHAKGYDCAWFLDDALQLIINHLKRTESSCNEDPIIAVILEDHVDERDGYRRSFERVDGFADYVFDPFSPNWDSIKSGSDWPTVKRICETKQRLLLFTDNTAHSGYYKVGGSIDNVYIMEQELWRVENTYNLNDGGDCNNRADSDIMSATSIKKTDFGWFPLFIMNHFRGNALPALAEIIAQSKRDNSFDALWKRYKDYCQPATNGKLPNFLSLDFYHTNRRDAQNFLSYMMQESGVILFEGNNVEQDALCYVPTTRDISYNLQSDQLGCDNDEARSMILTDLEQGTVIVLTDSPEGLANDGGEDDFTIIYVKQAIGNFFDGNSYQINSFEIDSNGNPMYEDNFILAFYYRNNGLDGKVSNVQVKLLGTDFIVESDAYFEFGAFITFKEGNSGTQNTVCTVSIDYVNRNQETINFKNDNYGCDNDETRSLIISKGLVGTQILLFDSPSAAPDDDDWCMIEIIKNFKYPITIDSYEASYTDEFVRVTYGRDNGLDGKVSSVIITPPEKVTTLRRRLISSNVVVPTFFADLIRLLIAESATNIWTAYPTSNPVPTPMPTNILRYIFVNTSMDYYSAQDFCLNTYGTTLAEIGTEYQRTRAIDYIGNISVWFGLSKYGNQWKFQDSHVQKCPNKNTHYKCIDFWRFRFKNHTRARPRCIGPPEMGSQCSYFDGEENIADNDEQCSTLMTFLCNYS